MQLFIGTSGYSYKEWKGSFYPKELKADGMLRYYAERLSACEINATFYRMPTRELLARWAGEVPPGFRFVLKAARRITHERRLKDVADAVGYFFETAAVLGDRLGPVLFQLPPNLKKDTPRLCELLAEVPPGRRAAFEFRHPSWLADDVYDALRARNAALCLAETEDDATPEIATADWGYLRLRRSDYAEADLRRWAERVAAHAWSDAHVFFKHEDEARGPAFATQFRALTAA